MPDRQPAPALATPSIISGRKHSFPQLLECWYLLVSAKSLLGNCLQFPRPRSCPLPRVLTAMASRAGEKGLLLPRPACQQEPWLQRHPPMAAPFALTGVDPRAPLRDSVPGDPTHEVHRASLSQILRLLSLGIPRNSQRAKGPFPAPVL